MFYDNFCNTDIQKDIFRELVKSSKDQRFISIQELDHLGYARKDVEETLIHFEKKGLLLHVYSRNDSVPVIFSIV